MSAKALWLLSAVKIALRGGEEQIPTSLLQTGALGFTASEPTQGPTPGSKPGMHWLCISQGNSAGFVLLPEAWRCTTEPPSHSSVGHGFLRNLSNLMESLSSFVYLYANTEMRRAELASVGMALVVRLLCPTTRRD